MVARAAKAIAAKKIRVEGFMVESPVLKTCLVGYFGVRCGESGVFGAACGGEIGILTRQGAEDIRVNQFCLFKHRWIMNATCLFSYR